MDVVSEGMRAVGERKRMKRLEGVEEEDSSEQPLKGTAEGR